MPQKRKLQIFVSSTYTDLRTERQAAVEAILTGGHIPAGMELFTAGNEAQMNVIKRWIDESDVYLLILGGRYGSVEPVSGKSYTHLEYEYAVSKGKPLFALVITKDHLNAKVKEMGPEAIETENAPKLAEFAALVKNNMVRFWSDPRDIKIGILEKLSEFNADESLNGWVPGGDSVDSAALAEELTRLSRENSEMRETITTLRRTAQSTHFAAEFIVDIEMLHSTYRWPTRGQSKAMGQHVKIVEREGYWLRLTISNAGNDTADIDLSLSGVGLFATNDLEDIQWARALRSSTSDTAWMNSEHNKLDGTAKFTSTVSAIRPGQSCQLVAPLNPEISPEHGGDIKAQVDIFPAKGEHLQKVVTLDDLFNDLQSKETV